MYNQNEGPEVRDTKRTIRAGFELLDGRDPVGDAAGVLLTLDQLVTTVLLVTVNMDKRKAVALLREGLLPHVEERIAMYQPKGEKL